MAAASASSSNTPGSNTPGPDAPGSDAPEESLAIPVGGNALNPQGEATRNPDKLGAGDEPEDGVVTGSDSEDESTEPNE